MVELFRHRDLTTIGFYESILESEGIETHIRNKELTMSGLTEIPIPEFYPALCVVHPEDAERALELLRQRETENAVGADTEVTCPSCQEKSPGNFDVCWSCSSSLVPDSTES